MGWFNKLVGSGVVDVATGVSNIVDKYVETPDEKRAAEILLTKIAQKPALAQVELNKIESGHRSVFVAGWRPALGWVCVLGLGFTFLVNPVVQWATGQPGPDLPHDIMLELVIGMLGLAGLRTAEKAMGKAK